MKTFAQNWEDYMLHRAFNKATTGFYIDVGAHHPEFDSVTKYFYDQGWNGINIEPIPKFFNLLATERPRDINLNLAIGNENGFATFYEVDTLPGLSTLSQETVETLQVSGFNLRATKVTTVTLVSVCNSYVNNQEISFLKIDVEGFERQVLEGADFKTYRPIIVLVEAITPVTNKPSWNDWEQILIDADYVFIWFDRFNRYYLRKESIELRTLFRPYLPQFLISSIYIMFRIIKYYKNHGLITTIKDSVNKLLSILN